MGPSSHEAVAVHCRFFAGGQSVDTAQEDPPGAGKQRYQNK